ncbi:MAG: nucleotidyltransferase [Ignavibacteria bacterium]|nr:MAG: nucleotidyltransferase [Ignavibacteria bacterium]KAF0161665.1 MAG: nucleotidyltransferase [Ignavibacteria bacterium]
MAQKSVTEIISIVKDYLSILKKNNIRFEKAFLFGSHAKGLALENSDIDIALIMGNFDKDRFETRLKLMRYSRNFSEVIEPHPFIISEFNDSNPFAREIIKDGINIELEN